MKFKKNIYKIYNFVLKHPMIVSRKICSYDFCLKFAYFRQKLANPYGILLSKNVTSIQISAQLVENLVFIDSLTVFYP